MDSNIAAAKAAPCKILLRISANLMHAFVQLKTRHSGRNGHQFSVFIFRPGRSPSHGWAVFPNDNGAYRVPAPPPVFGRKNPFCAVGDRKIATTLAASRHSIARKGSI